MSERLPYEEQLAQQWGDLPLPDENMAWADMKRRLDEDDDDRLVPVWLRGCALWGIVAVLVLGFGWWIFRPEKWFDKKKNSSQELVIEDSSKQRKTDNVLPATPKKENTITVEKITPENGKTGIDQGEQRKKPTNPEGSTRKTLVKKQISIPPETQIAENKIPEKKESLTTNPPEEKKEIISDPGKRDSVEAKKPITIDQPVVPAKNIDGTRNDTTTKKNADSLQQKQNTDLSKTTAPRKDSARKKQTWFAAGIAMNQQLPVNGQKFTPYNSEGRKGSLSDYIPSVYLRMYRNDKWFIQSEFRYGAPQYNKDILYNQKIQSDTFNATKTTSLTHLKKTFYHQLPLSFNYFITKNWSAGTGVIWNKFVSAVSTQDIIRHYNQTGIDSIIAKDQVIRTKQTDSNFVKSYFQGIFETQYRWSRFSVGLRYAFGLEPYLKFTLPGGLQQQEKNNSLNLFLRYELWRSKKNQ
jgi:hypothetical protein